MRKKQNPEFDLGDFVGTADFEKVLSKGDSTNYSNKICTRTEIIHDKVLSCRNNCLLERCNENLLRSTKITLDENNQVMKS